MVFKRFNAPIVYASVLISLWCFQSFSQVPQDAASDGKIGGCKVWQLPNAPSGTRPDQCWHAVGCAPDGDIYISGHDHATNSMLYRLNQDDDILYYVGDARAASQAVDNWQNGETAQKFHTRPIYYDGRVYVGTTDRSNPDGAYLQTRGFHWYAYDIADDEFLDISKDLPGGVGAAHLQMITINVDPTTGVLYGTANASCEYVRLDLASNEADVIGKPSQWTNTYTYCNRFFWVDSRHRVYLTAGNERSQWYQGENKSVYDNVFYYDESSGQFGEVSGFGLQGANAIEVGQWNRERTRCYMSDDQGHIYRFEDDGATWTYLGTPDFSTNIKVWVMHVSPDEEKIYIGRCDNANGISEYDIESGECHPLCSVSDIDNTAASCAFITGYDAWDRDGRFYISSFSMNDGRNVYLVCIDPVRVKVSKGLLPSLVEVTVGSSDDGPVISRTGSTGSSLPVIYQVEAVNGSGVVVGRAYGEATIPSGQQSVTLSTDQIPIPSGSGTQSVVFYVMADGNDYVVGSEQSVNLGNVAVIHQRLGSGLADCGELLQTYTGRGGAVIFRLNLPAVSNAKLSIYDTQGRLVKVLADRRFSPGAYDISWDHSEGAGLYTARVEADGRVMSQKFVCYK